MPHIHTEPGQHDFTTSAFILHPSENKILLHMHRKLGKWLPPGGHVELAENIWQALEHELLEETGLLLGKCALLGQPDRPELTDEGFVNIPIPFMKFVHNFFPHGLHKHSDDSYLLRSYTEDLQPAEGESQEIGWHTIDEIVRFNKNGILEDNTLTTCRWIADRYFA